MQSVAEAMHVEKREGEQKTIGARNLPAGKKVERVRRHVVVREHGAFGDPGGAGSIDDAGGRIAIGRAVDRDARALGGQFFGLAREIRWIPDRRRARKFGCRDYRHRIGVGEDVVQFAFAVEDVDGNENHAQLDAGQVQVDHLEAVGEINAQPVARLKPALQE
jgi:hypothetical protein